MTLQQFINKARLIYGDKQYNYHNYIESRIKATITCSEKLLLKKVA